MQRIEVKVAFTLCIKRIYYEVTQWVTFPGCIDFHRNRLKRQTDILHSL